jgi:hypothetical protein
MLQIGWTGGLVTLSACTHLLLALSCADAAAGAAAGALRWCDDGG